MTLTETGKILLVISTMYQSFEMTKPKAKIWHEMLEDIEFECAYEGLKRVIKKSERIPTVAEIRREAEIYGYVNGGVGIDGNRNREITGTNTINVFNENESQHS